MTTTSGVRFKCQANCFPFTRTQCCRENAWPHRLCQRLLCDPGRQCQRRADFEDDCWRHKDIAENLVQQIEMADLVQGNQRAGVRDNGRWAHSFVLWAASAAHSSSVISKNGMPMRDA